LIARLCASTSSPTTVRRCPTAGATALASRNRGRVRVAGRVDRPRLRVPHCCLSRHKMALNLCASCAPVTTETSGLPQTSMDFHGLTATVVQTAKRSAAAGLDSRPAWLSGGGGIRTLDPPSTDNGFRDRRNVARYTATSRPREGDRRSPGASCQEAQPPERGRDELKPIFTRAVTHVCQMSNDTRLKCCK
jgi:hypothetical protein